MYIDHLALWTTDVDRLEHFYTKYFEAKGAPHYRNPAKGFESVFLRFDKGSRLEIMKSSQLTPAESAAGAQRMGLTHFAFSLGSARAVDQLADRLRADGYPIIDGPRRTGDGYYECVVLDPDGNRVEIAA